MDDQLALAVETANTELLELLNKAMLYGWQKWYAKRMVQDLCDRTQKKLISLGASDTLIIETIEGLKRAFIRGWLTIISELRKVAKSDELGVIGQTIKAMETNTPLEMSSKGIAINVMPGQKTVGIANASITNIRDFITDNGYESKGAGERYVDYVDRINNALVEINDEISKNTLDTRGANGRRISVRNMAEIETRYKMISESLDRATADGNKFVVASAHADASERCSWWQGKIYIVDLDINSRPMGQYKGSKPNQRIVGHIDGKPYYSLLEACENGFLSFNCQHRLIKYYKGVNPPHYDMVKVKMQRALTARQRELENRIRIYKRRQKTSTNGLRVNRKNPYTGKTENMNELKYNQLMSKYWQERYSEFSKYNNLPEYRWRLRITEYEE